MGKLDVVVVDLLLRVKKEEIEYQTKNVARRIKKKKFYCIYAVYVSLSMRAYFGIDRRPNVWFVSENKVPPNKRRGDLYALFRLFLFSYPNLFGTMTATRKEEKRLTQCQCINGREDQKNC